MAEQRRALPEQFSSPTMAPPRTDEEQYAIGDQIAEAYTALTEIIG